MHVATPHELPQRASHRRMLLHLELYIVCREDLEFGASPMWRPNAHQVLDKLLMLHPKRDMR